MEKQNRKPDISAQPTEPNQKPYHYQKPPTKQKPTWLKRLPVYLAITLIPLVLLLIVGLVLVNALADGQYADKIEPGVSVSGVYVGEMTREQARQIMQNRLTNYSQRPVLLAFQDKTWQPTLEQLGISINLDVTLNQAFAVGKVGGLIEGSRLYKMMNPQAHNLPLELQMDENKLKGYLSDVSDRIRKEVIEPNLEIKNAQINTTNGADGFNVDFEVTYDAIKRSLVMLQPASQNLLTVHNVPPVISQQELTDFKTQLEPLLSGPLTFKWKEKTWVLDQKAIAKMIEVKRTTDPKQPRHFSANVDTTQIEKFVTGLSKEVNQEPKDAKITWENNQIVVKEPSATGQYLVVDKTVDQAIKLVNNPTQRTLDLLVDIREPQVDSNKLEALGLKEMIGEGVSGFAGSALERATNITVGAKYLNGALIKPHTVFSFLGQIGEISEKRGYMKGYAIIADQTVPDVGGGICQVATTTFRAAFYAGTPIVERNAHLYRVSWYEELGEPVGFDAAVYEPGVDMKFENNTDNWMAISAFVKSGKLYVQVWGTKTPGQTVELIKGTITNQKNPPPDRTQVDPSLPPGSRKQVDYAHPGLDTTLTRVIKINGAEVKRDQFFTRFQAWPNIFKVGRAAAVAPSANLN
ncbi:MAG: VanW family protein [Chloroflexota bacterium]|nr:VanW family protein [Chloroflexota bacterium]